MFGATRKAIADIKEQHAAAMEDNKAAAENFLTTVNNMIMGPATTAPLLLPQSTRGRRRP